MADELGDTEARAFVPMQPDPKKLIELGYRDSGSYDRNTHYYSLEIDDCGGPLRAWCQDHEGMSVCPYDLLPDSALEEKIPWYYHAHPALKSVDRDLSLREALLLVLEFHDRENPRSPQK
jgi:hypothetical protein